MIPVNEPDLKGNELTYLKECIETGWISSEGPFVKKFEGLMANFIGRKYAIAVANGSVALDAAVVALGIGPGDEVILPSFTIISCAASIYRAGAMPVVIDCDLENWNIDVNLIRSKISKKTKAIMAVHIYGLPVNMNPIIQIAKEFNLKIIEDAAEAIGQTYNSQYCGSFGDISIFSFYPNKHITTGEGGMILTDDEKLAERCYQLRNLCFVPTRRFVHYELGWNFRMTNLQAALGIAQFERLSEFIIKKRQIGQWYKELLSDLKEYLTLPVHETDYATNIYWVFGIILTEKVKLDASEMMKKLHNLGIGTRPYFYPIHLQPVFRKEGLFLDEICPNSEKLAERGFYLPSGLTLTFDQVYEVTQKLRRVVNENI